MTDKKQNGLMSHLTNPWIVVWVMIVIALGSSLAYEYNPKWRGIDLHIDVYYQTATIIITMYVLLVAFRAERFVRRTNHEEELSLELAQRMMELMDAIRIDIEELGGSRITEYIDTRVSYFDTNSENIFEFKLMQEYYRKGGYERNLAENWPSLSIKERLVSDAKRSMPLIKELLSTARIRSALKELDETNHRPHHRRNMRELYRRIKTEFINFRSEQRAFITAFDDAGYKEKKAHRVSERLHKLHEIESDVDKFVRSKQQGTDQWEWGMLAGLGFVAISLLLFFFPVDNQDISFYPVKIPAIFISGVIGYLFIKLLNLESDRSNAMMSMPYSLIPKGGRWEEIWPAYFGASFFGKGFESDRYAEKPYEAGFPKHPDIPACPSGSIGDNHLIMWMDDISQLNYASDRKGVKKAHVSDRKDVKKAIENIDSILIPVLFYKLNEDPEFLNGYKREFLDLLTRFVKNLSQFHEKDRLLEKLQAVKSGYSKSFDHREYERQRLAGVPEKPGRLNWEDSLNVCCRVYSIDNVLVPAIAKILEEKSDFFKQADPNFLYLLRHFCKNISISNHETDKALLVETVEKEIPNEVGEGDMSREIYRKNAARLLKAVKQKAAKAAKN